MSEQLRVSLIHQLLALGLEPGAVGLVTHKHIDGAAYDVKFYNFDGRAIGVQQTLAADQVRVVSPNAVPHVRQSAEDITDTARLDWLLNCFGLENEKTNTWLQDRAAIDAAMKACELDNNK